eukprot:362584-Chlamydomonas_euryale.AAC.4
MEFGEGAGTWHGCLSRPAGHGGTMEQASARPQAALCNPVCIVAEQGKRDAAHADATTCAPPLVPAC